jgi:hypothetical protein
VLISSSYGSVIGIVIIVSILINMSTYNIIPKLFYMWKNKFILLLDCGIVGGILLFIMAIPDVIWESRIVALDCGDEEESIHTI